jgi:putative addiction module component (TIGR02574 family)
VLGFALEARNPKVYPFPVILEQHPDIQRLSPSEKLALVTELWDDLAAHPADIPVTGAQIAELDRRMEEYRKDPKQVTTWEVIKQRILGSAA